MATQFEIVVQALKKSNNNLHALHVLLETSHKSNKNDVRCSDVSQLLLSDEEKAIVNELVKSTKLNFTKNCKLTVEPISNDEVKVNFNFSVDKASVLQMLFVSYSTAKRKNNVGKWIGVSDCSFLFEKNHIQTLLDELNATQFVNTNVVFSLSLVKSEKRNGFMQIKHDDNIVSIMDVLNLSFNHTAFWQQENAQKLLQEIVLGCLTRFHLFDKRYHNKINEQVPAFAYELKETKLYPLNIWPVWNGSQIYVSDLLHKIKNLNLLVHTPFTAKEFIDKAFNDVDVHIVWRNFTLDVQQLINGIDTSMVQKIITYTSETTGKKVLKICLAGSEKNLNLFNTEFVQKAKALLDEEKRKAQEEAEAKRLEEKAKRFAEIKKRGGLFMITLARKEQEDVQIGYNNLYSGGSSYYHAQINGDYLYYDGIVFEKEYMYGDELASYMKKTKDNKVIAISELPEALYDFALKKL